jgi:hypothetical protein
MDTHKNAPAYDAIKKGEIDMKTFDEFTKSYMSTALWSSTIKNDEPLDKSHTINDINPGTIDKMVADCLLFQQQNVSTKLLKGSENFTSTHLKVLFMVTE